jgi:hypothetical protein
VAIALFSAPILFAPLQGLVAWLTPRPAQALSSNREPVQRTAPAVLRVVRPSRQPQPVRPLRVVRFVDAVHVPSSAGRMVISGRMADVCAELDRLAQREAPNDSPA